MHEFTFLKKWLKVLIVNSDYLILVIQYSFLGNDTVLEASHFPPLLKIVDHRDFCLVLCFLFLFWRLPCSCHAPGSLFLFTSMGPSHLLQKFLSSARGWQLFIKLGGIMNKFRVNEEWINLKDFPMSNCGLSCTICNIHFASETCLLS